MARKYALPSITEIRKRLAHRKTIGREGRNKEDGLCAFHERDELGYIAWHAKADRLMREGMKQVRCEDCGKWLWPHELGNPLTPTPGEPHDQ